MLVDLTPFIDGVMDQFVNTTGLFTDNEGDCIPYSADTYQVLLDFGILGNLMDDEWMDSIMDRIEQDFMIEDGYVHQDTSLSDVLGLIEIWEIIEQL